MRKDSSESHDKTYHRWQDEHKRVQKRLFSKKYFEGSLEFFRKVWNFLKSNHWYWTNSTKYWVKSEGRENKNQIVKISFCVENIHFPESNAETTKASKDKSPDDVHDRGGGFVEDQACNVGSGQQERHEGQVGKVGSSYDVTSVDIINLIFAILGRKGFKFYQILYDCSLLCERC